MFLKLFPARVVACCMLVLLAAAGWYAPVQAATNRPNIVFLLVDDLRRDEVGYAGYPVPTPNIDRLASEGVRFDNAFVTSSLCSPSRASYLTGLYPHGHGVTGNTVDLDYATTATLPGLLQAAGYTTALVGKWHMGNSAEPRPGFDYWFAMPGQGDYENPQFNDNGHMVSTSGYNTDIITAKALEFIDATAGKPFFLQLAYKSIHGPFTPAPRHQGTLSPSAFTGLKRPNAADDQAPLRRKRAETLLAVDDSVGAIFRHLGERGLLADTVLVLASDNGYLLGEHGLGDKRFFYEEAIRIPLLVHYPARFAPGTVVNEPVLNIDFAPAMLELAGAAGAERMHGKSFVRLAQGDAEAQFGWRQRWVYEYFAETQYPHVPTHLAVVGKRFKYVTFPEGPDMFRSLSGEDLLFDLKANPWETKSVAGNPALQKVRASMVETLRRFATDYGLRFFPLDQAEVNRRIQDLYNDAEHPWFRVQLDAAWPGGYPGWVRVTPHLPWQSPGVTEPPLSP